jgi:hypothetical protein
MDVRQDIANYHAAPYGERAAAAVAAAATLARLDAFFVGTCSGGYVPYQNPFDAAGHQALVQSHTLRPEVRRVLERTWTERLHADDDYQPSPEERAEEDRYRRERDFRTRTPPAQAQPAPEQPT